MDGFRNKGITKMLFFIKDKRIRTASKCCQRGWTNGTVCSIRYSLMHGDSKTAIVVRVFYGEIKTFIEEKIDILISFSNVFLNRVIQVFLNYGNHNFKFINALCLSLNHLKYTNLYLKQSHSLCCFKNTITPVACIITNEIISNLN